MDFTDIRERVKKAWNWMWNSDSFLSWVVSLIFIFVIVKFVFFPLLSLIMGTSLPLAGVESSSMDHRIIKDDAGRWTLCGKVFAEKKKIDFDEYWKTCGEWYEKRGITKEDFMKFPLKNGFRKGDVILIWGRFEPKVGDIIVFNPNLASSAPRPIIHRIVKIENGTIETKGDHNANQLTLGNNFYRTDETHITREQIIGKAILKIPYLGWPKIWLNEFFKFLRRAF